MAKPLAALLQEVNTAELEVILASTLSSEEQQRLRRALEVPRTEAVAPAEIIYRVNFVDGSELEITLDETSSVQDAVVAIAHQKGLSSGQLRLLVCGSPELLPVLRSVRLLEAAHGSTELMAALSSFYRLGKAHGLLSCEEVKFDHYASWAYLEEQETGGLVERELERDRNELDRNELCEGYQVTMPAMPGALPGQDFYQGIIFSEGVPLVGKILLRFLIHERHWAIGLGIGTESMELAQDPEYDPGFLGLYHGGRSINICKCGKRTFRPRGSGDHWIAGHKLAILLDLDEGSMQCFDDLIPFGPKQDLPRVPLWPAVVLGRAGEKVSVSVSCV